MIVESQWATFGETWATLQLTHYYSPIDRKRYIPADIFLVSLSHFAPCGLALDLIAHGFLARAANTLLITKANGFSLLLPPSARLDHLSH